MAGTHQSQLKYNALPPPRPISATNNYLTSTLYYVNKTSFSSIYVTIDPSKSSHTFSSKPPYLDPTVQPSPLLEYQEHPIIQNINSW